MADPSETHLACQTATPSTLALHETRQRPAASAVVMLQYQQQFESRFLIRVHLCPSVAPFFGLAECSEGG